jgi:hypothetical protein
VESHLLPSSRNGKLLPLGGLPFQPLDGIS